MKKKKDLKSKGPIYFDYSASTPIDPLVLKSMAPAFQKTYANTMSLHALGQDAKEQLEKIRDSFAKFLKINSGEIIFTGSATESNNFVIKGIAFANQNYGKHIIISSVEHPCILNSARWLENKGFKVSYLSVDKNGVIDVEELASLVTNETILVSVMHVNNEMGAIQPVEKIGKLIEKEKNRRAAKEINVPIYFHTDASQSFGKIELNINKIKCDLLTLSSHKIYGPKGASLLYTKKGTKITPLIHGGGHEFGFRSGTVNVPVLVGFCKAAELAVKKQQSDFKKAQKIKAKILKTLQSKIRNCHINGTIETQSPFIISVRFDYIEGESLVYLLDSQNICASSASACASLTLQPSHVLLAMGLQPDQAHSTIRISFGRFTTDPEVQHLLKVLPETIGKLRSISVFK